MLKFLKAAALAAGLQFALAGGAYADAAAEKYVDDALPMMYHSCTSVVEETNGNVEEITKVIRALVAVSIYNHDVDISKIAKTDEEKTALQQRFVAELKKQCEADKQHLLAGAIDDAVFAAMNRK